MLDAGHGRCSVASLASCACQQLRCSRAPRDSCADVKYSEVVIESIVCFRYCVRVRSR